MRRLLSSLQPVGFGITYWDLVSVRTTYRKFSVIYVIFYLPPVVISASVLDGLEMRLRAVHHILNLADICYLRQIG
jgi:hypothetical protein